MSIGMLLTMLDNWEKKREQVLKLMSPEERADYVLSNYIDREYAESGRVLSPEEREEIRVKLKTSYETERRYATERALREGKIKLERVAEAEQPAASRGERQDGDDEDKSDSNYPEVIYDLGKMRADFTDYTPKTAEAILDALPKAHADYSMNGGEWGPSIIARHSSITIGADTAGRYLRALRKNRVTAYKDVTLPGRNRHRE